MGGSLSGLPGSASVFTPPSISWPVLIYLRKNVKKRKYSEDFLQYGFTSIITAGIEKPQCVICCEVLSAESTKPNKLKRHFDSKHSSFAGKDTNYFRSKADGLKKARLDTGGKYHKQNVAAVEASYLVAPRMARAMKPHNFAEDLMLPAAKDIVRVMIGDKFLMKLSAISLSNDTVRRRIDDMSADIIDQVIQEIKSSPLPIFSIQLDESTDVANCSQLLVYMRYINDGDFKDEFLFCKPLEITTTACDVFDAVCSFLKEHKISWEKVCGVCTDGAPAMLGCRSGFQRLILNESPKVMGTHCMIHQQMLAMKTLPQELQEVMKSVISCVNFVKASTLNSQLFSQLCNELDAPNNALLFHPEARWLSREKNLKHVFELRDELKTTDFSTMPVTKFWIKCLQSYPVLSETVLRLLLPFPTTYLCETGFSSLLVIKSKYRSRLVVEDDLHCALAKTAPRISDLMRKKQSQPSH
ncbi:PREDICTED: LOW QUALITY PROTEIN: protein ZBED8-like [Myotis brandtii]|uniref:LOW QUALITY PROTEIN: protein ZBED8-like n=1 Tax=Myotis brandtii TaxID=109478 RepID=UPI0007040E20|nr:PREDICTED: LOW QUALITY PROTEIN: protein ZBED8-like [Myotis brandtii]